MSSTFLRIRVTQSLAPREHSPLTPRRHRPSDRSGSDSAVRFGRAARQLHPHQQTFAMTIKTWAKAVTSDCFRFWKKFANGRVAIAHRQPRDVAVSAINLGIFMIASKD